MKLSHRISGTMAGQKMARPVTVPFAEWMPDLPAFNNPGATTANNVIPRKQSYGPIGALATKSDALTARAQGVAAASNTEGAVTVYAGDETKLYSLAAEAFTDRSKSGGYSTSVDSDWEFTQFGNTMLATNYDDPVQGITVGGTIFSDHFSSSDKPKFRHMAIVGDFVVGGNSNDSTDGVKPNRVWWSGINDSEDFTPSAATQCDFNDLPAGGWVQRIIGGEYGVIFLEREIVRMSYRGSPLVFRFDRVEKRRGTPIPGSVINLGRLVFFISEEGFFAFDGIQSTPIGVNKVDRQFWDNFDTTYISRVSSAIDPINKLVIWGYPDNNATAGSPNKLLIYNWQEGRWSDADVDHQILGRSLSQGLTLDGLDTLSTNIDTGFLFSFDSRAYTGGEFKLTAFDTSKRYCFFTGNNLAATIETGEFQLSPGKTSHIRSLRPHIDGGTITAAIAPRALQTATATFGTAASINTSGECSLRDNSRFQRVRCSVASGGTWTHAQGVEVTYVAGSRR
jgi:hypothetical protein